jgi:cupin fold WbuC family metalloprotein
VDLTKLNDEVFVASAAIVQIGPEHIRFLKQQAAISPRKRARICAHRDSADPLHEMLIALSAESYIHPHKHLGRSESFHIVEGTVDVVVMDDAGEVIEVVALGDPASGRKFYYRLDDSLYHTLLIRSSFLVVHEVTTGPFDRSGTLLASFAPSDSDVAAQGNYMTSVASRAAKFTQLHA